MKMRERADRDWRGSVKNKNKVVGQNGSVIFKAKGKAFSKASVEVMNLFKGWLDASGICEEDFFWAVKRSDFTVRYSAEPAGVSASFMLAGEPYGVPFICNSRADVERFNVDLALILIYVGSECGDEKRLNEFIEFVKENKLAVV